MCFITGSKSTIIFKSYQLSTARALLEDANDLDDIAILKRTSLKESEDKLKERVCDLVAEKRLFFREVEDINYAYYEMLTQINGYLDDV